MRPCGAAGTGQACPPLRRHAPAEGAAPLSKGRGAGPPSARLRCALPCRGEFGRAVFFPFPAGVFPAHCTAAPLVRRPARAARPYFPAVGRPPRHVPGKAVRPRFPSRAGTSSCGSHAANTARLSFPPAVHACAAMRCQCGVRDGAFSLSGGCFPGALCRRAASPAACACRTSLLPGCGACAARFAVPPCGLSVK